MASNGLIKKAIKGKCRICQRQRCTEKHVSPVGEMCHGFATGYIWECNDSEDCTRAANKKINNPNVSLTVKSRVELGLLVGKFKEYKRII